MGDRGGGGVKGGFLKKNEIQNSYVYAMVIFPRFPDGADASVFKS